MAYRPIPDWSPEGRREIVDRHEVEMVAILEEAFTNFMDEPASSLDAFATESSSLNASIRKTGAFGYSPVSISG
jgi:hypothetical protein